MRHKLLLPGAAALACACGSPDPGGGTARITVWGEDLVEEGIPDGDFADGWGVTFDRFLIGIGDVIVASGNGEQGGELAGRWLLDLVTPGPHELGALELPAQAWTEVGYSVGLSAAGAERHGSITEADAALVLDQGLGVLVSGEAERGGASVSFSWGFDLNVALERCGAEIGGREQPGFVVEPGRAEVVELTIHGDHLFFDDLGSPEAELRFDPIAGADADGDGHVTLEELDAVSLLDVTDGPYGAGGLSGVHTLADFIRAQTRFLGHFRGEGECVPRL